MAARGKADKLVIPQAPKKWVMRWKDHVLREIDMTLGDLEDIEVATGKNWYGINPLRDAKHAVTIVSVMVARLEGRDYDEVRAEVRAVDNESFFDAFITEEDDLPERYTDGNPPVAARQTATSRGSGSSRGAGRQK